MEFEEFLHFGGIELHQGPGFLLSKKRITEAIAMLTELYERTNDEKVARYNFNIILRDYPDLIKGTRYEHLIPKKPKRLKSK